jgi:Zn-dependent alcohol dehydrogenase
VAFVDPPLLNTVGVHQPFALRAIVQLDTDAGLVGLGETYADTRHLARLGAAADAITGMDVFALNAIRAAIAARLRGDDAAVGTAGMITSASAVDQVFSPFEVACLVGCGVTTGYGSAVKAGDIRPGDDVAIIGVGGVGMSALQGAVNAGARNLFVIEPVEWKRDAALKFGATHAYPDIETAFAGVAEVTHGLMAKQVIVTVGELEGKDVDNYVNLTSKGGTPVLTAIGSMMDTNVTLNLAMLTLMQKRLQGTIFGGGNPHFDIPQLLSMYKAGRLNLDDMVTRQYQLEQINEGYTDMLEGRNIRGVIRYTDADR